MSPTSTLDSSDLLPIVRQSADLIRVVTADGVIVYASDASETLLGYPPCELVGHNVREFRHPEEDAALALASMEAELGETAVRRLHRVRHADGSYRWLDTTARSAAADGQMALVLVSRDATCQVHTGRELALLRRRLAALVHAMSEPVVMVDRELHTVAVSSGAVRAFVPDRQLSTGVPLAELCGSALDSAQVDRLVDATREALATQCAQYVTVTSPRRADGAGPRWVVSCSPLSAPAGGPSEAMLSFEPQTVDRAPFDGSDPSATPPSSLQAQAPVHLTRRESEVLNGLAQGLDAHHLACRLHISENTVRGYIKALLQKLHAHSQLQAVMEGIRIGAVSGDRDDPVSRPTSTLRTRRVEGRRSTTSVC
ncbi:MAG: PAS domain-containing protein [Actinomycetes bacterium]